MSIHQDILRESDGALFRRADLHIHSFGDFGSYDVDDTGMTPEAIVDMAIAENLHVVAITDHNTIGNVRRGLTHASAKPVFLLPGVELSTAQGHLLIYCPTIEALEGFFGKLNITPDHKVCHTSMSQCLKLAGEFGGIGIAAHIDLDSGFEKAHAKYDAFKQDILNCPNLLALEVAHAGNNHWFSHADDSADRRNCVVVRCKHLGQEQETEIARVMNSDAHSIGAFGRNAQGAKKLTRLKMDCLTFDSFRLALMDCAARVRLEDLIPPSIPYFIGMKLEGGFLNGQVVQFSKNLTCIIGGRGAGKSTMLESLRVSSGNPVENTLVDSDVWPDAITLIYQDEVGQIHHLSRNKLNPVVNQADPVNGMTRVNIESYGQGETAATIQHCDQDPDILLRFLDDFIQLDGIPARDEEIRTELLENRTEIERLNIQINRIPELRKAKATADQQLDILKKQNAGQLVELEQRLATERRFREQLSKNMADLLKSINDSLTSQPIVDLKTELETAALAVGKAECEQVMTLLSELSKRIDELSASLKSEVRSHAARITEKMKEWIAKEQETQNRIEEIRRELEKQKIKLDIAFIRKVTKDSTDFKVLIEELEKLIPLKEQAFSRRRALMKERRTIKSRLFTNRQAFATLMNKNLAATVVDYSVSIRFHEGVMSAALEELIKGAMDWRTSQVPKAALIARAFSPFTLLDAIEKKDTRLFEAIKDATGTKVFSAQDATRVIETLYKWENRTAIERCEFEDRPEIRVTKTIVHEDGKKSFPMKDFSQLSLGQQQSILLSIMLFSKSTAPLIIDQPEDNLDSEFIYKTLVRCLRSIKEQRQVIIVTHNANIAVLGDAELIIPLRGASELAVIRDRGSIDNSTTKEIVCTILEGSKMAFKRRQQVYGF